MFPLAIFTPFLISAVLLLPVYAGILGAAYVIYLPQTGAHPLTDRMGDVFYIIDVYGKLLHYWMDHKADVSFVDYTLPVIGLPLLGLLVALYATYKTSAGLLNIFRLSASH